MNFASCVERCQELEPYIPDFRSILFDLSLVPDIDLTGSMVQCREREKLDRAIDLVLVADSAQEVLRLFDT